MSHARPSDATASGVNANLFSFTLSVLLLAGIGDALVTAFLYWWPGRIFDGTTSGVWTALAFDFSQGHLYRPIFSDAGYGGTRYMPLFFMFHGSLIRLGLDPILAGVVAMQASVVAMLGGIVMVLVQFGVSRALAGALALVTLCTSIFQQYLTDANCDYLAAAFGLFALACYLPLATAPARRTGARLVLVALLCVLAFATKFTALYVPAALFLHMVLNRRWRDAALFTASGLVLATVLLGLLNLLSGGLMWQNIALTATGNTALSFAIWFPLRFLKELFYENPAIGVLFLAATAAWLASLRSRGTSPASLCFVMVSLATLLTYASFGIAGNHVIGLEAFAIVVIGANLDRKATQTAATAAFAALTLIVFATWAPGVPAPRKTLALAGRETRSQLVQVISGIQSGTGPVLADNPAVPVILGARAYMLDKYNFDGFYGTHADIRSDFQRRLARHEFSLIVLKGDFDPAMRALIDEAYAEQRRIGEYTILAPRQPAATENPS